MPWTAGSIARVLSGSLFSVPLCPPVPGRHPWTASPAAFPGLSPRACPHVLAVDDSSRAPTSASDTHFRGPPTGPSQSVLPAPRCLPQRMGPQSFCSRIIRGPSLACPASSLQQLPRFLVAVFRLRRGPGPELWQRRRHTGPSGSRGALSEPSRCRRGGGSCSPRGAAPVDGESRELGPQPRGPTPGEVGTPPETGGGTETLEIRLVLAFAFSPGGR